jgi:uncharacterized protein
MRDDELPLFPLSSVLFPGGELRLRIFEPRYTELVRWCTREQRPFGVCLILDGNEAGAPATPAAFGTSARIADFYTLPDGLLGISASGEQRFHVRRTKVRDNGLIVAEIDRVAAAPTEAVRPEHGLLVVLLDHLLEQIGGPHAQAARPLFDQAEWVGFRLAELLPIEPAERQRLLQCEDQHARLDLILRCLPDLQSAN